MKQKENNDLFSKLTSIYIENDNMEKERLLRKKKEQDMLKKGYVKDNTIIQNIQTNGKLYKKIIDYPKQSFTVEKKYKIFRQTNQNDIKNENCNLYNMHNLHNSYYNDSGGKIENLVNLEEIGNKIFKLNKMKKDFKNVRKTNNVKSKSLINKVEKVENNNIEKIFDLNEIKSKLLKISFYRPSIKKNFSYLDKM